jgi:DNA-binding CsgD family transcriptional regulator
MTWRDRIPVHPYANLFPRMTEAELQTLGKDIKNTNELQSPFALFIGGECRDRPQLLDGVSRLDAMESVRIEFKLAKRKRQRFGCPWFLHVEGMDPPGPVLIHTPEEALAYVTSINFHRRHLTAEQKRESLANLIKAQPEKSDRQIARMAKVSPTTVGTTRAKMEAEGEVSKLDTRVDAKGIKQSARRKQPAKVDLSEAESLAVPTDTANDSGRLTEKVTANTPEHIEQIRNLIERGHSREEIAEIIGITVGALQVTCSKLGISLRRRPSNFTTGKELPARDDTDEIVLLLS